MLMKNPTDKPMLVPDAMLKNPNGDNVPYVLEPGEEIEVKDGYAHPRVAPNRSRMKSLLEMRCPGIVPADPDVASADWFCHPTHEFRPPRGALTIQQMTARGLTPGQAHFAQQEARRKAQEEALAKAKALEEKAKAAEAPAEPAEPEPPMPAQSEVLSLDDMAKAAKPKKRRKLGKSE